MTYYIIVTPDPDAGYIATMPELPGCISDGVTRDEAIRNVKLASEDYIYFMREDGLDVPEPMNICEIIAYIV